MFAIVIQPFNESWYLAHFLLFKRNGRTDCILSDQQFKYRIRATTRRFHFSADYIYMPKSYPISPKINNNKAYKYALSILPQRAKFFLISLLQYGFWYVNIKTAMHVLIDALRNISPSELKYDFFHIWC